VEHLPPGKKVRIVDVQGGSHQLLHVDGSVLAEINPVAVDQVDSAVAAEPTEDMTGAVAGDPTEESTG
jgi:hypothetical protein